MCANGSDAHEAAVGLAPYGLVVALALAVHGWRLRTGAGRLLVGGSLPSTAVPGVALA